MLFARRWFERRWRRFVQRSKGLAVFRPAKRNDEDRLPGGLRLLFGGLIAGQQRLQDGVVLAIVRMIVRPRCLRFRLWLWMAMRVLAGGWRLCCNSLTGASNGGANDLANLDAKQARCQE